jgi:hypothetical protein
VRPDVTHIAKIASLTSKRRRQAYEGLRIGINTTTGGLKTLEDGLHPAFAAVRKHVVAAKAFDVRLSRPRIRMSTKFEVRSVPTSPPLSEGDNMALADLAGQVGVPDQPQPSLVILEIRDRMAKLDRIDEIVHAVNSMRVSTRDLGKV